MATLSINRPHLRFELAKALLNYIKAEASSTYFYFGNGTAAAQLEKPLLLNRISPLDVYLCYDRINWEKSKVFPDYNPSNTEQNTHILTKNNRIYKCLDNLSNSKSLIEPSHTTFNPVRYEDGYVWKYLYTLSNREIHNYLTDEYIPISISPALNSIQNQTEFNAISGTIDSIKVIKGGTNYTRASIEITGDGTGCTAVPVIQSGIIKAIKVTNPGKGYTKATVKITGTGLDATAEVRVSPKFGHGSNLIKELNASNVMVISQHMVTEENLESIPETFSYNTIGLFSEISGNFTGRVTLPLMYKLKVSDSSKFTADAVTINSNLNGSIVHKEVSNGSHYLYVTGPTNNLKPTDLLNKSISSGTTIKDTILEVASVPFSIPKDYNILHLETLDTVKTITNKNLDILRIVIKGLPTQIEP